MLRFASLLAIACIATGCNVPKFEHVRTENQTIETRPIDATAEPVPLTKIDLTTFNGPISVTSHDSELVTLEVTYKAYGETEEQAKENAELLKCDYAIDAGVLSIRVNRPVNQSFASIGFKIKVPRRCSLALNTSNGRLEASGIDAGVVAETSNGSITLRSITGDVNAKTSNGRVSITQSRGGVIVKTSNGTIDYSGELVGETNQLRTSNGGVSVALNPEQLVQIEATTSNGKIGCTLATQKVIAESKKHYHAMVGAGDENESTSLSIITSNGNVSIKEMKSEGATDEPDGSTSIIEK